MSAAAAAARPPRPSTFCPPVFSRPPPHPVVHHGNATRSPDGTARSRAPPSRPPPSLPHSRRYAGFGVSVVGIVAYRGPYFGVFDTLKDLNPWKKDNGPIGLLYKFAIAQTTAIIAGFISYPFDTVRRRLQMQAEKPKEQWLYSGTADCAVKIVKEEGMGAMFKGFGANVLRILGALVLVGYDEIKRMIG